MTIPINKIPEISVIVPCYNQAQYLDECIISVMNQTYQDWECIIINDGSSDNTEEIAKKWCNIDNRIKYFKKENEGVSSTRNFGISKASGNIILPLDADDKIGNEYMELALLYFKKNNNIKIVYCKAEYFGNKTGLWNLPPYSWKLLLRCNMLFCSSFFYKNDYARIGGYDTNMTDGYEDWEFFINLLKDGGDVVRLNAVQFYYRIKDGSRNYNLLENNSKLINMTNIIICKHMSLYNNVFGNQIQLINMLENIKSSPTYKTGKILLFFPKLIKKYIIKILKH
jgi:glycosyltransferase involved in cell wall biosynthesis